MEITKLSKTKSTKRGQLSKLLDELKYWLQLPCSAWLPSYDASLLDVDSVLASLPRAVHWRISVADAAKQRFLRAREEMVLMKREIESAKEYYSHFISECERTANVLHHKQEMALEVMGGTAELEGEFLLVAMQFIYRAYEGNHHSASYPREVRSPPR